MRIGIATMFFLIGSFIFFVMWAVFTFFLNEIITVFTPLASDLSPASQAGFNSILALLPTAFGVICVLFFVFTIIFIYFIDSMSEDPEMYYRRQP